MPRLATFPRRWRPPSLLVGSAAVLFGTGSGCASADRNTGRSADLGTLEIVVSRRCPQTPQQPTRIYVDGRLVGFVSAPKTHAYAFRPGTRVLELLSGTAVTPTKFTVRANEVTTLEDPRGVSRAEIEPIVGVHARTGQP